MFFEKLYFFKSSISHTYFPISSRKRFFQRIDKIHINSINDTNKCEMNKYSYYQSNRLTNFNFNYYSTEIRNILSFTPLVRPNRIIFDSKIITVIFELTRIEERKEKNIYISIHNSTNLRPTYEVLYYIHQCNKARYEATSLNMNGSFKTKEEVLHTRNSREIPFWRPAERAWNVFLDRIRRAVKKHRDREKLVERERETRRRLHVSVSIRKKDRGRRTGQVGKEAWKDHWACPDRSNRKTRCFIKAAGSMLKHRPR